MAVKIGRNEPCPCGSGKKFKHCCLNKLNDVLSVTGDKDFEDKFAEYRAFLESRNPADGPVPSFMEFQDKPNLATNELNALTGIMENMEFRSELEMRDFVNRHMQSRNNAPQKDFLGLSPSWMNYILNRKFSECGEFVELAADISRDLLGSVPALEQCLFLLRKLSEKDKGIKATQKGNFPRVLVREFYEKYIKQQAYHEMIPMKEEDVTGIQKMRFFLDDCGLMKKRYGWFSLTRKGQDLLKNNKYYEIYKTLFHYFTGKFNWLYMTTYHEDFHFIQQSLLFCLYMLKVKADEFIPGEELASAYKQAFPQIVESMDTRYVYKIFASGFHYLFFKQFARFLELVEVRDEEKGSHDLIEYRTTELFRRIFAWKI